MVEFVSLFLALALGSHTVEVTVTAPAVRAELLLDGTVVAELDGPPWSAQVDLGHLAPRRLEAVAYDGAGRVVDTAEQWLNVPRPTAEARLVPIPGPTGMPAAVRLTWESQSGKPPESLLVTFDGRALGVTDPERIDLPPYDPERPHFVTAEMTLPGGSRANAEISFGGVFGAEVTTELTAVPVRLRPGAEIPGLDSRGTAAVSGWLRGRGRPLEVAAVEKGDAEVVMVRDVGAEDLLIHLRTVGSRVPSMRRFGARTRTDVDLRRYDMQLEPQEVVRMLWPHQRQLEHPRFDLRAFASTVPLNHEWGGIYWFLTRAYPPLQTKEAVREHLHPAKAQHLSDAVAVAGLGAAAGNGRRAVVLVTGSDDPKDGSYFPPDGVRAYLELIGVPLHIWSRRKDAGPWGEGVRIDTVERLREGFEALQDDLASQRLLWVEGRFLPGEIELDASAADTVRLLWAEPDAGTEEQVAAPASPGSTAR